jgi:hypothetical protein
MKVCICGTVKNVGKYLPLVFKNMEKIGSLFEDYKIIIYYDKSNDNTLHLLQTYQKINNKLSFYVNNNACYKYRTYNIAKGRNYCLSMIRKYYIDYEYFIMMDCDEVCASEVNIDILNKYLNKPLWDGLSFNRNDYYDIWALSIYPFIVSMRHFSNLTKVENRMRNYISKLLLNTSTANGGLLPCLSAFNGFAIYKTNKFINCNYDGRLRLDLIPKHLINQNKLYLKEKINFVSLGTNENTIYEDCEHRSFHLQARHKNKAKLFISPDILFK